MIQTKSHKLFYASIAFYIFLICVNLKSYFIKYLLYLFILIKFKINILQYLKFDLKISSYFSGFITSSSKGAIPFSVIVSLFQKLNTQLT